MPYKDKTKAKACARAYYLRNRSLHRQRAHISHLKRNYGMTLDAYNELLTKQGGKCFLCGELAKRTLCIDHDHKTGKVRGLLCIGCNTSVGVVEKLIGVDRLNAILDYIWSS